MTSREERYVADFLRAVPDDTPATEPFREPDRNLVIWPGEFRVTQDARTRRTFIMVRAHSLMVAPSPVGVAVLLDAMQLQSWLVPELALRKWAGEFLRRDREVALVPYAPPLLGGVVYPLRLVVMHEELPRVTDWVRLRAKLNADFWHGGAPTHQMLQDFPVVMAPNSVPLAMHLMSAAAFGGFTANGLITPEDEQLADIALDQADAELPTPEDN